MKRASRPDWKPAWRKLRAGIKSELREYPPSQVEEFVRSVGIYLGTATLIAELLDTGANESKRLRDLKRLRRVTEKFIAESGCDVFARPFSRKLSDALDLPTSEPDVGQRFFHARHRATTAASALLAEIDTALKTRKAGRPAADETGLLARIAARWRELFEDRPTATRGGKFESIAVLVLEHMHGPEPHDVSRQVRAALKVK